MSKLRLGKFRKKRCVACLHVSDRLYCHVYMYMYMYIHVHAYLYIFVRGYQGIEARLIVAS